MARDTEDMRDTLIQMAGRVKDEGAYYDDEEEEEDLFAYIPLQTRHN